MSFWKGLPASVLVHAAAAGIVFAGIAPRETVEDVAAAPVELVLEIESSPVLAQQPVNELAQARAVPEPPVPAPPEERIVEPEPQPVSEPVPPPEPEPQSTAEPMPPREPEPQQLAEPVPVPVPVPAPVRDLPPPAVPTPESLSQQASQIEELASLRGNEPLPAAPPSARQQQPKPAEEKPAAKRTKKVEERRKTAAAKSKPDANAERKDARSRKSTRQTAALAAGKGSDGRTRSTDGRALEQSYKSKVLARLRSVKRYPEAARRKKLEGTAVLSFTINARGQVTAARISGRSGHAAIDGAALAMARNAAPFPPFPPGMGRQQMSFRVPVQFKID
jgi:protein TonB